MSGARGPRGRRTAALACAALCAALLAACGVRTTSVPVDAGAAPSRLPCEAGGRSVVTRSEPGSVPVRVYLVCASGLVPVERSVPLPARSTGAARERVPLAQALLRALAARPSADERRAGFSTSVDAPLRVAAGRAGDPAGTLRLSAGPDGLPPTALAQVVCTLVENAAVGGRAADGTGRVLLAGPGAQDPPRAYGCDPGVKADPDAPLPAASPSAS
ncbi:hypothetical protein AB0910_27595 [Streptomyces sp. NPDC047002]|uniref:hypothetical protein n=1 Tax=Streptomyces sp. NPDC047002 TaxID=3155475 RepID=UPI00345628B9